MAIKFAGGGGSWAEIEARVMGGKSASPKVSVSKPKPAYKPEQFLGEDEDDDFGRIREQEERAAIARRTTQQQQAADNLRKQQEREKKLQSMRDIARSAYSHTLEEVKLKEKRAKDDQRATGGGISASRLEDIEKEKTATGEGSVRDEGISLEEAIEAEQARNKKLQDEAQQRAHEAARNTPQARLYELQDQINNIKNMYGAGDFGALGGSGRSGIVVALRDYIEGLDDAGKKLMGWDEETLERRGKSTDHIARQLYMKNETKWREAERAEDPRFDPANRNYAGQHAFDEMEFEEFGYNVGEGGMDVDLNWQDPANVTPRAGWFDEWLDNQPGSDTYEPRPGEYGYTPPVGPGGEERGPTGTTPSIEPTPSGQQPASLDHPDYTYIGSEGGMADARSKEALQGTQDSALRLGNTTPGGITLPPNPYRTDAREGYHPEKAGFGLPDNMAEVGIARVWLADQKRKLNEANFMYDPSMGWIAGVSQPSGGYPPDPGGVPTLLTGEGLARAMGVQRMEEHIATIEESDIKFRYDASGTAIAEAYDAEASELERRHELTLLSAKDKDAELRSKQKHEQDMAQLQEKYEQERHGTELENEFALGKLAIEYEMKDQMQAAQLEFQATQAELDRSLQQANMQAARDAAERQHQIKLHEMELESRQMAFSIFSSLTQSPVALYFLSQNGGLSVFENLFGEHASSLSGSMAGLVQHMKATPLPNIQEYDRLRPEEQEREDFRIAALTGREDIGQQMQGESPLDFLGRAGVTSRRPINVRSTQTALTGRDYRRPVFDTTQSTYTGYE